MATQSAFSQAASTQVTEAFFQGIGDGAQSIANMEKVVSIDRDDVASLKKAAMEGITTLQAWDGIADPTGDTLATVSSQHTQTVTYSTVMLNVRLPSLDVQDIGNLVSESSRKLGFAVSNTVVQEGWTQVSKMWTHDAADGVPPIDIAHPLSTSPSTVFDNKETTTLDAAGLANALSRMRRFKSLEGDTYDASMLGPIALVVPPELAKTAAELILPAFSGSDLSANFFAGYQMSVVSSPHLSDSNNWALVMTNSTPVHLWIRSAPVITSYVDPATNTLNLRCQAALAGYFQPPGYQHVVGNTPA